MMCQILFILTLPDFVSLNICIERNIRQIGDFKMQLSSSIRVSIMKDFLKFIRSLMKIEYAIF